MKKYVLLFVLGLLIAIANTMQTNRIKQLTIERDLYKDNTEALLKKCATYETREGLHVAQADALTLKVKDFEKYRKEDAELIKQLETKNRQLNNVTTTQLQTIAELKGNVYDSIVTIEHYRTDTIRCVKIRDAWYDFEGCVSNGEFTGTFTNRDSLLVAVTTKYKRFLFWRTKKIKNQHIDIVSRNPYTKIGNIEYIMISE